MEDDVEIAPEEVESSEAVSAEEVVEADSQPEAVPVEAPVEVPQVVEEVVDTPVATEQVPIAYAEEDTVELASLVFEAYSRRSTSVFLVQERLSTLGYFSADDDNRGWLSIGTRQALADFCGCSPEETVVNDKDLITRLFSGTIVKIK